MPDKEFRPTPYRLQGRIVLEVEHDLGTDTDHPDLF